MRSALFAFTAAFGLLTGAGLAAADCVGANLFDTMPAAQMQDLQARAGMSPFANGNFWRATKDGQEIHLIGTYHMDDARHAATMARLEPVLDGVKTVMVEAGPDEMAALKQRIGKDPDLMVNTNGPSLPESLTPALWDKLSDAVRARGVPPFMAAKMKPWYLTMILSIPPCALENMGQDNGLDAQIIAAAQARALPIQALEPYDTVFSIFGSLTEAEQISMITQALALEDRSEDMSVTMAEAYFSEDSRLIWEFTRDQTAALPGYTPKRVEAEFAKMEEAMMKARNRAWIPVLTTAAAEGPVLAGFGALHLSGDQGVLALLQAEGYTLERLAFQ